MSRAYIYDPARRREILAWMEERIEGQQFHTDAKCIGVEQDGELIAAVGYDRFSPHSCCVHVAADKSKPWLTREFLKRAFYFPFEQLGFRRITALVSEYNEDSLHFVTRIGWVQEGVIREEGPNGEDLLVFGMLRRECPYV